MGINVPITADNKPFMKAINEVKRGIEETAKTAKDSGEEIEAIFDRMKSAAAGFFAGYGAKEFVSKVIEVRGEFQKLEVSFKTMLGSAEKADELMSQLTKTAAITPFGLEDVANGAKQLLAFGISAEEVNDTLIRLGDISAGLSIPLNDLVYLYGTTMTQGQLFTQDLRQFMSRGIPLADELAEMFGVAKDQVDDLVTAGKVGFEEVKIAIENMTNEGSKFGGLMDAQSKTISGQISNIEDAIDGMFNNIGKSQEGIINKTLSTVSYVVDNYERFGRILLGLVATYGAYKTAVMIMTAVNSLHAAGIASVTAAQVVQYGWTVATTKAMQVLNKTMMANPYVLAAVAIMGVVTAMLALKDEAERLKEAEENYNTELEEAIENERKYRESLNELADAAANENLSIQERIDSMQELAQKYPDILAKYDSEIERLDNIRNIMAEINDLEESKSIKNPANELKQVREDRESLEDWYIMYKAPKAAGDITITTKKEKEKAARYEMLKKREAELERKVAIQWFESLFKGDTTLDTAFIEELEKQLSVFEHELKKNKEGKGKFWGTDKSRFVGKGILESFGFDIDLTEDEVKSYLGVIRSVLAQRNSLKLSSVDYVEKYQKEAEEATQRYNDYIKKTDNEIDEVEFRKESENLRKDMEEKQKRAKQYQEQADKEAEKRKKEEEKRQKELEESRKKQAEAEKRIGEKLSDLIKDNIDTDVELMKDGSEKKLKEVESDYNKRLSAIQELKEEFQKENEKAGVLVGLDGLTEEQRTELNKALLLAEKKRVKDEQEIRQNALEEEKKAWNDYYIQFGNYQERRLAITQKYEDLIAKAETQGQKASLAVQRDNELEDLDIKFGKSASSMADLFEDASEKSINAIQALIDKYETLVNFMSTPGSVSREDLFALGFTERDLEKIEKGEISIKDITDAIKNLKREVGEKSPFKKFAIDINKAFDKIGTKGNTGQGFIEIGDAVNSILPEIEKFATDIETIFGVEDSSISEIVGVVGGIGDAALGFGRIMSGDVLGGITSAAGGVASMIQNIQAINEKAYQQEKERLTDLANIYKELADKRKEEIDINNPNAVEDAKTAIDYYNKEREKYKDAYNKYLDRGKSSGWRASKSEKLWAHMSSEAIAQLEELTRKKGSLGIYELVNVDLDVLKENTELWNALDDETREYLENIHASNEAIEETGEKLKQAYTGITLDDFYSSFVSTLTDMDASAEDFANNFEQYLYNAIISSMVAKEFQDRINKLYENWATASEDGLTDKEVEALRKEEENLTNDIIARRDAIKETYQFGQGKYSQQDASSKGFQSMSQETGEELNGRFTALQMAGEDIRTSMQTAVANMGQLITLSTDNNNTLLSIRESLALSNSYLFSIDDTAKSMLKTFKEQLNSLITNTENL